MASIFNMTLDHEFIAYSVRPVKRLSTYLTFLSTKPKTEVMEELAKVSGESNKTGE